MFDEAMTPEKLNSVHMSKPTITQPVTEHIMSTLRCPQMQLEHNDY